MDSRFDSQFYLDEIEYGIPYRPIVVVWGVTGFAQAGERPEVCENCGHPIRNMFFIASNTGQHIVVGSECVKSLCSGTSRADADKLEKRANRAASQWRKNTPPRKDSETRHDYTARRITEMANAFKAHRAWIATSSYALRGRPDRRQLAVNARARKMFGIQITKPEGYYVTDNKPFDWRSFLAADTRRIERKYKANRYDFCRATWDVRKI